MTKEEKKNYVLLSRRRYGELTDKKDKGAFLDQFCAATGMSRKNAIRRLSPKERPHRRRGRPFKADVAARNLLVRIWKLADRPCGKLLRPVLGVWIACLRKDGADIPEETAAAVLGMSTSTIDRRLRGAKPRIGGRRRASSLSEHRYRKVFEKEAGTPAQRVLEDPHVSRARKRLVRELLDRNDPITLKRSIRAAMDRMWQIISREKQKRKAAAEADGGSALRAEPSGTPPSASAAVRRNASQRPNGSVSRFMTQPRDCGARFR